METVDNWEIRDPHDVEEDVKVFMSDLLSSFEMRVASSSKPLLDILTCLDLDNILRFSVVKDSKLEKQGLGLGEGALERYESFTKFFT